MNIYTKNVLIIGDFHLNTCSFDALQSDCKVVVGKINYNSVPLAPDTEGETHRTSASSGYYSQELY